MNQVGAEIARAFGQKQINLVIELANVEARDLFGGPLLFAIMSRETNIRNIVGDGGHGRGVLQQDDRYQQKWLRSVRGCASGTWKPIYASCYPEGRVPTLRASVMKAIQDLNFAADYGARNGVKAKHLRRFAIAAYNCGIGNALKAYQNFGIGGIDAYTAHGNYSADVLGRKNLAQRWLENNGYIGGTE